MLGLSCLKPIKLIYIMKKFKALLVLGLIAVSLGVSCSPASVADEDNLYDTQTGQDKTIPIIRPSAER